MIAELKEARRDPLFSQSTLTDIIWAPRSRKELDSLVTIIEKEPLFQKQDKFYQNRRQALSRALKGQIRLLELKKEHGWDRNMLLQATHLLDDPYPFVLHFTAFVAVIEAQGTKEQIREWIPRCERMEILGSLTCTFKANWKDAMLRQSSGSFDELSDGRIGHGSNVQGLETTATYIPESDQFEINSPTLTSTKWWVGGLGVQATHALVQASLHINRRPVGPHLFIVPVRSLKDHSPLPNIEVGDIGSKAYGGFATSDNGYVRFDHVRIPRNNMLQRYSHISPQGEFTQPKQEKLSYGSMINLRVFVVNNEVWNLARALTIAVRYASVRRQFSSTNGTKEDQIITYSSVKYRLFPLLGMAFAYLFAAKGLMMGYMEMMSELKSQGESKSLAEVHALSTGLKACSTWDCLAGIEECRKACGGHGFSVYAGIGHIWANGVASQTYEGDNYVISQQTARACLKYLSDIRSLPSNAQYLGRRDESKLRIDSAGDWKKDDVQTQVLESRARQAIIRLAKLVQNGTAWKDLNMDCVAASRAHIEVFLLRTFTSTISSTDESLRPILRNYSIWYTLHFILLSQFALHVLVKAAGELLTFETITPTQSVWLAGAYREEVLGMTAREAVQITDAFRFTDYELGSVLGRFDGRVYEALWEEVRKDPVNVEGGFEEDIRRLQSCVDQSRSKL